MTTALHRPAAWAAAHRTLLVLVAVAVTAAIAAAVVLSVLLGTDDAAVTAPAPVPQTSDDGPCALPRGMTVTLARLMC
ncbi:hypothetical protein [Geodermatophilus sp. SYSU D00766]